MNTEQCFPWGEHLETAASLLLSHVGEREMGGVGFLAGNKTKKAYSPI